jgi:hypothetical protein
MPAPNAVTRRSVRADPVPFCPIQRRVLQARIKAFTRMKHRRGYWVRVSRTSNRATRLPRRGALQSAALCRIGEPLRGVFLVGVPLDKIVSQGLVVRTTRPGSASIHESDLGISWPNDVDSLSQMALPFPPRDARYGGQPAGPGICLDAVALLREQGVQQMAGSEMLRLRWNPSHPYLKFRVLVFLRLGVGQCVCRCPQARTGADDRISRGHRTRPTHDGHPLH